MMKKNMAWIMMAYAVTVLFCGCNGRNPGHADIAPTAPQSGNPLAQVEISVNGKTVVADFEDNPTRRALVERMPMTLEMLDLYGREMCHRFGADALPTGTLRSDGYEVGDIAYWPPAGSLVILYAQNGERFERQHVGRVPKGVELFSGIGTVKVEFKVIEAGK